MLKSSGAMAVATVLSRLLGLAREVTYSRFMGDSPVASAFKLAFAVPNLFRRLLGEGALTAAFIPIFKEKEKTQGELEMWRAANAVISALLISTAFLIGLALLGLSLVLSHATLKPETELMLRLMRVMMPYMMFVCLAAVLMGMLNARGYFFIPALGASVLNVVMIATVLFAAPGFGETLETKIFALAIGVLVAGVAQAAFQLPGLFKEGFRFRWVTPWSNDTVRRVMRQMLPATIGVAAYQFNVLVTLSLGFLVEPTIVASFDYAVRLMELPQGVFGVSMATYLLPTLSGLAAEKKYPEFRGALGEGLGYLIFINSLAAVFLFVLAEPIIRLLFEGGKFDVFSTRRAALALQCLAPGLVAFSAVNVIARAFYALGDTKTPMLISVVCLAINLVFAIVLVYPLRQGGLALANSLSSIFNACLLLYALRRKLRTLELKDVRQTLPAIAGSAVLAGLIAWGVAHWWTTTLGHRTFVLKLGEVFVPMTIATLAYLGATHFCGANQARELVALFLSRLKGRGRQ